jgi:type I restriction-modification system DNA methylase subunit
VKRGNTYFKETKKWLKVMTQNNARNRGVLFAQVYLDSKLAAFGKSEGLYFLETLKDWFVKADKSSLDSYFSSFIGPVLDVLGFAKGELNGNIISLYADRNHEKSLSLCYIVHSDESLDQTVKGKNYSVFLVKSLKKVGLNWGILTNGKIWRLYCVKEKAPFETFFQINLDEALQNYDATEMALFADFFQSQTFLINDKDKCGLDINQQESEQATKQIEEHLQGEMEHILGKICMGFIKSEKKEAYTEEEKRTVFNNSIYVLYRLLFVLYAEARELLPIHNQDYYAKSMTKLMEVVKQNHCKGLENPEEKNLWNFLCELFNWINQGHKALDIPPYNGGLFDNNEKQYLAHHVIENAYLSEALFNLGFREEKGHVLQINYNDLSVRHLGGLYEGILEYQLFIAPERMVRRTEKNVYKFILESQAGKITRKDTIIEKGEVYFSQSSGERKITGSYYTPEEIVRHIVEYTIGQHLEGINNELKILVEKLIDDHNIAIDNTEKRGVQKFIDRQILSFVENKVLSIKILDPAMGSGHFLVNASYFLANYIVESICTTEWENDSVDASPLLWRRRAVEKCVFGVDINELATELAKLSFWLITADNKKPLTFLDHHLRTGNSLLGTELSALGTLPTEVKTTNSNNGQTTLDYPIFEKEFIPEVLQAFTEMEESSEEIEDVERKKVQFEKWEKLKQKLESVADIWLATLFGYEIEKKQYRLLLNSAMEGKEVTVSKEVKEIAAVPTNSFFHWWIEFPEIFFGTSKDRGNGGFDVVIGNPPWGSKISSNVNRILARKLQIPEANVNTCALFILEGLKKLKRGGFFGFLLPKVVVKNEAYYPIRKTILEEYQINRIVDFGQFPGVASDAVALVIMNGKGGQSTEILFFENFELIKENSIDQNFFLKNALYTFSLSATTDTQALLEKIRKNSKSLGSIFKVRRGIELGQKSSIVKCKKCLQWNEANTKYYGNAKKRCKNCGNELDTENGEVICISSLAKDGFYTQECISGAQLQRYYLQGLYFIPLNLKGIDYKEEAFTGSKILIKRISDRIEGTITDRPLLAFNTVYSLFNHDVDAKFLLYTLGILNSRLFRFFYEHSYNIGMSLTTQVTVKCLSELPIRIATESRQQSLSRLVARMLSLQGSIVPADGGSDEKKITQQELTKIDAEIDKEVYEVYEITEEEIKIIEKYVT